MEPLPPGVAGQVQAVQRTLQLLLGLLAPCLLLLVLLTCLLVLRCRPSCRRVGPASPALSQVVPGGAAAGLAGKPLPPPGRPAGSSGARGPGARPKRPCCSPAPPPPRARPKPGAGGPSSGLLSRLPTLAPPNSPATTSGSAGVPDGALSSCLTSTQNKLRRCGRSASVPRLHSVSFEYGSSIPLREDQRAQLSSANFTTSQGPGLDSDFGVSAGVSVRVLSSDSEGSPNTPLLCRQHSERFEWDYYDPSYKRKAQLHHQLPHICSKQYWL
ncbi:protein huluwa-like [Elgaria multicarinata webbii]|uniref:protein huluwa-like n=1 Tax=Elgaria multicarinata webbii TaxID=159646 RepID=UPI002FCD6470